MGKGKEGEEGEVGGDRAALRSSLTEWHLLAQADALLGDQHSGFTRAALLASRTGVHFSGGSDCQPCCGPRGYFCHEGLGEHFLFNVGMNSGVRA